LTDIAIKIKPTFHARTLTRSKRNIVIYTWVICTLSGFAWMSSLWDYTTDVAIGGARFRTIWWGILVIIYGVFSFWTLFRDQSLPYLMALIASTFAIANESLTQICVGYPNSAKTLTTFTWIEFLTTSIFFAELILWRNKLITNYDRPLDETPFYDAGRVEPYAGTISHNQTQSQDFQPPPPEP